jgi:protoheme IX farnesyltransferase
MSEAIEVSLGSGAAWRERVSAYAELTKPRIGALVLIATCIGFYLAVAGEPSSSRWWALPWTLIGTALVAGAANALNQLIEREYDARMERTRRRPLPSGRLTAGQVLVFGVVASLVGVGVLAWRVNLLCAGLAAVCLLWYVGLYTPLKRWTPWSVFVGAVPGALPPLIGWAGGTGSIPVEGWLVFAIVFCWQLPHFLAIAWLYREDYARAGFPVVPVVDPDGVRTNLEMVTHSLALMTASLLPFFGGFRGAAYAIGAMVLGTAFLGMGVLFVLRRTEAVARGHLLASVLYLPSLLALMMLDQLLR